MEAVIPMMRRQRGGIIVNITSLGGRISFPLNSPYHATKFALEGLSESIQYELEPFGIKIIVIEPLQNNMAHSSTLTISFLSSISSFQVFLENL